MFKITHFPIATVLVLSLVADPALAGLSSSIPMAAVVKGHAKEEFAQQALTARARFAGRHILAAETGLHNFFSFTTALAGAVRVRMSPDRFSSDLRKAFLEFTQPSALVGYFMQINATDPSEVSVWIRRAVLAETVGLPILLTFSFDSATSAFTMGGLLGAHLLARWIWRLQNRGRESVFERQWLRDDFRFLTIAAGLAFIPSLLLPALASLAAATSLPLAWIGMAKMSEGERPTPMTLEELTQATYNLEGIIQVLMDTELMSEPHSLTVLLQYVESPWLINQVTRRHKLEETSDSFALLRNWVQDNKRMSKRQMIKAIRIASRHFRFPSGQSPDRMEVKIYREWTVPMESPPMDDEGNIALMFKAPELRSGRIEVLLNIFSGDLWMNIPGDLGAARRYPLTPALSGAFDVARPEETLAERAIRQVLDSISVKGNQVIVDVASRSLRQRLPELDLLRRFGDRPQTDPFPESLFAFSEKDVETSPLFEPLREQVLKAPTYARWMLDLLLLPTGKGLRRNEIEISTPLPGWKRAWLWLGQRLGVPTSWLPQEVPLQSQLSRSA